MYTPGLLTAHHESNGQMFQHQTFAVQALPVHSHSADLEASSVQKHESWSIEDGAILTPGLSP